MEKEKDRVIVVLQIPQFGPDSQGDRETERIAWYENKKQLQPFLDGCPGAEVLTPGVWRIDLKTNQHTFSQMQFVLHLLPYPHWFFYYEEEEAFRLPSPAAG